MNTYYNETDNETDNELDENEPATHHDNNDNEDE